jgi:hypothetical protein
MESVLGNCLECNSGLAIASHPPRNELDISMDDWKPSTLGVSMSDDRCCGSGTCIINAQGECWCGQKWDGEKMCQPYFVNESGVKINSVTGKPIQDHPTD